MPHPKTRTCSTDSLAATVDPAALDVHTTLLPGFTYRMRLPLLVTTSRYLSERGEGGGKHQGEGGVIMSRYLSEQGRGTGTRGEIGTKERGRGVTTARYRGYYQGCGDEGGGVNH